MAGNCAANGSQAPAWSFVRISIGEESRRQARHWMPSPHFYAQRKNLLGGQGKIDVLHYFHALSALSSCA
eukprot:6213381-Pleurochrysis_carterae.AAC.1